MQTREKLIKVDFYGFLFFFSHYLALFLCLVLFPFVVTDGVGTLWLSFIYLSFMSLQMLMELEDWSDALHYCRLTIPVYQSMSCFNLNPEWIYVGCPLYILKIGYLIWCSAFGVISWKLMLENPSFVGF